MSTSPQPRSEQPSTYFVQDRTNQEELQRLALQDNLLTMKMGGVLPEQTEPITFQRILDVGCGTGGWLLETAQKYPQTRLLIGIDASASIIAYARTQVQARELSSRVEFHTMDALRMLEFPSNFFDLVNQRAALSFLRTWDWTKLLNEYLRVARPGATIRLTEADVTVQTNSAALTRIAELVVQVSFQSGRLFSASSDSIRAELPQLLARHGVQQVQIRDQSADYSYGDPGFEKFTQDMRLLLRTSRPFLSKWLSLPTDYEALCQQALHDMQQPDFQAQWTYRTAWGIKPL